ncbi:hypothetical protein [Sulfurospirillum arcachonense]|uniref:hypothetical protein n=1 Tax=Sulfurospirillum arcachonense TaxID=57666 RepID=UPI000468A4E9|nr:hypothetical protein [Sulfurospirillum arcachonense]
MSINVDLSMLKHQENTEHVPTKVHSDRELESIRNEETKVIVEGDLFTYRGVNFKPMSEKELLSEKIDTKLLNLTQLTSSNNSTDDRVIVAFRDPNDPENVIAYKLDKEVVDELKGSFSSTDFFQREDGILRLNANAEKYIAGWVLEIKEDRGYEKADVNADGIVDENEDDNLNVGFEHYTDYEYLGEKIVTAHSFVGERTYQKFSDTADNNNLTSILNNQALEFENTIEKELAHTIELDKDKDGTITLKEGMVDFTPKDKDVEKHLADKVKQDHDKWVSNENIVLDPNKIMMRDIVTRKFMTEEEWKAQLEMVAMKMKETSINIIEREGDFAMEEIKKLNEKHEASDIEKEGALYKAKNLS